MKNEYIIAALVTAFVVLWYHTSQNQAVARVALTGATQPEGGFNNLYRAGDHALRFDQLSPSQRAGC